MQYGTITETNVIETKYECDVLVAGGGVAGIAAALAAARSNKRVILLERSFLLGGLATAGLVTIYLPICDGRGRQVCFGLAEELLHLSIQHGAEARYPEKWLDVTSTIEERAAGKRFEVQFNAQLFAIAAEKQLTAEGVKILYGTSAAKVVKDGDTITHIITENKSGRQAIRVRGGVVDATGDADVCHLADAKTATFTEGNKLAAWYYYLSKGQYRLNMLGVLDVPDEDEERGHAKTKLTTERRYGGVDAEELSGMVEDAHSTLLDDILKRREEGDPSLVPVTIATTPQVRMTRRLVGKYELDESEERKHFSDSVGLFSDWRRRGPVFELPFSSLYTDEVKNLISAGRCISVTDAMWDITRVIPVCAVSGEAAGVAAAMTNDFGTLDVGALQDELTRRGVKLHIDF